MEVVGGVASILALVEIGKKLKESVGSVPVNQRRLQDLAISINQDLESLRELVQTRSDIDVPRLRDAVTSLEVDLQEALRRTGKMAKSMSTNKWIRWVAMWKDAGDIEVEMMRIEQRISNSCRRFSMSGVGRVEVSLAEITSMTDQLRAEVHQRLDFVEDHLKFRVGKAKSSPADAEALVGIQTMTPPAIEAALVQTTAELELHSPMTLESQYLHIKVETLTSAIMQLPAEERPCPSRANSSTHRIPTGDASDQTEDAIMSTIGILRTLRTRESSAPVTQVAAALEDLSIKLLDLGLYEDAHQTYLQVVRIYRGSVEKASRPATIDARVARALIGVSTSLQRLGRSQDGLDAIREAESIFRRLELEDANQGTFHHELALALNNMANHLRDSGDYPEARRVADEAVQLRRKLTAEYPDVHKADLAASLLNSSTCYSKLPGLEQEALAHVEEAVNLSRELVASEAGVFEPHLGASLHNAANRRATLRDYASAYNDIQEAMGIRRKLVKARPDVFGNGLIRSLTVAKSLALKCGDLAGADAIDEERRAISKSSSMGGISDGPVAREAVVMHTPVAPVHESYRYSASIPSTSNSPEDGLGFWRRRRAYGSACYTPNTALYHVLSPRPTLWDLDARRENSRIANRMFPYPSQPRKLLNSLRQQFGA